MKKKPDTKQPKKEDEFRLRSLWPVVLFGTAVVLLVGYVGRKATEK